MSRIAILIVTLILAPQDFPSDAKPQKVTARRMIAMTREINTKLLAGFPAGTR